MGSLSLTEAFVGFPDKYFLGGVINFTLSEIFIKRGGINIMDYQKAYYILFNAMTDAINAMDNREINQAAEILKSAQIKTEDMYIESKPEETDL